MVLKLLVGTFVKTKNLPFWVAFYSKVSLILGHSIMAFIYSLFSVVSAISKFTDKTLCQPPGFARGPLRKDRSPGTGQPWPAPSPVTERF